MANIGIIAALDCEIEMFISDFAAKQTDNKYIYHGKYSGHDIYLTLCGIGKVNAAICSQRLCDYVDLDVIINSGVAGGVCDKLNVCDVAISDTLTYHDFRPLQLLDKYSPGRSVFKADNKLIKLANNACKYLNETGEKFNYENGMIVSGDIFVEDNEYKKHLKEEFNAVCTEMEGAAVVHTALVNNVSALVIRAISDNADGSAGMTFDEMCQIAAVRASKIVKEIIKNY